MGRREWPTPLMLVVETALGMSPLTYISEARGEGRSWRTIARWLSEDSGIRITQDTVTKWASRRMA